MPHGIVSVDITQEEESVAESIVEVGYAGGVALLAAAVGGDVDVSYHHWLLLMVGDGDG